jgi:hypothetical protein
MLGQPLDGLIFADLEALLGENVQESRTLEFKRELVGPKDDDRREFLADVSAFANTAGGDLVFGIEEKKGMADAIPGVELADPDAEIRRLENILRTGLEPRLPRMETRWIPQSDDRGVLVVRTPRSWAAPHRVTFRDHSKFYGRNSAGKYPLDVAELRAAFVNAAGLIQSIRRFRNERVATVEADEGPVPLRPTAKLILHIVPLSAFAAPQEIVIDDRQHLIRPLVSTGFNTRYTLEGVVNYTGREDMIDTMYTYALLFRSGIIEAVSAIGHADEQGSFVAPETVEWDLLKVFKSYCDALTHHTLAPPFYIFLSLTGVRNHRLFLRRPFFAPKLRTDVLLLPELTVDDPSQSAEQLLRPLFDLFWNAFGFSHSASFDKNGQYIGERY